MRRTLAVAALVVTALLLASCAAGPNPASGGPSAAGFWQGLWQGFILPVTFVVSLFTDTVNIYEVHNDGNWYDFGYVLGLSIIFSGGGGAAGSRRR